MPRACGAVVDGLQNNQITEPGPTHPPAETKVHLPPHRLSSVLVRFPPKTQRGRRRKSQALVLGGNHERESNFGGDFRPKQLSLRGTIMGIGKRNRAGIRLGRATYLGRPPGGCSRVGPGASWSKKRLSQTSSRDPFGRIAADAVH